MIPAYPVIEQPQKDQKNQTPIIYQANAIDYLVYVKIGNIVLSSFMLIWMVLLLLGNWGTFTNLMKNPTVGTITHFGFAIIVMLVTLCMFALALVIQFMPAYIKTSCDDLKVVLCAVEGILLVGGISVLIWSLKMLALGINLSIILTMFYPLAVGAITFYLLDVILRS